MKNELTKAEWEAIIEAVMPFADNPADCYRRALALASMSQAERVELAQMFKRINNVLKDAEKKGFGI